VYLNDLDVLRKLAIGIFAGGLNLISMFILETVWSPQLHRIFYGHHAHDFSQTIRYGRYRPTVLWTVSWLAWMSLAALITWKVIIRQNLGHLSAYGRTGWSQLYWRNLRGCVDFAMIGIVILFAAGGSCTTFAISPYADHPDIPVFCSDWNFVVDQIISYARGDSSRADCFFRV